MATHFRERATSPERVLWSYLRAGRLGCLKFRRQKAIGRYVVDFVCFREKLIIEIHENGDREIVNGGEARAQFFESLGYRTIRLSNDMVLTRTGETLQEIAHHVCGFSSGSHRRSVNPSPR